MTGRIPPGVQSLDVRGVVERVDELLEVSYRQGDLGNVDDPLAETVYIFLSRQTQQPVYQAAFARLRAAWPRWLEVLDAPRIELEDLLRPAGLYRQRAGQFLELLEAVRVDNEARACGPYADGGGDLTLDYLSQMPEREALAFLLRLPGIGEKSARCVLSYSLGHDTFAVDTHVARILHRLGVVARSGGKIKHDGYDSAIPKGMRSRLHVNLIHHGRAVCKSENPQCGKCVLVSFCATGRTRVAGAADAGRRVVDLFAGAGGLSAGYLQEGFSIAAAVELDRDSAQTYRANHPGTPVLEADITQLRAADLVRYAPAANNPAAVISGTPCQGYSAAGARDPSDPRNRYYSHVTRLARALGAASIAIENVPGLLRVNGTGFLDEILADLKRAMGWASRYELTASHYGVPQNRRRFLFLAAGVGRVDQALAAAGPDPTHRPRDADPDDQAFTGLPVTPALKEALADLPEFGVGVDAEWLVHEGGVLLNASTMRHSERVVRKISGIKPGQGPISYRRLTDDVARTLVAGHRALPVHPWLDRAISVREAARIQAFDDGWVFCGTRANQPIQVANAVPPPLGAAVARFHVKVIDVDAARTASDVVAEGAATDSK